MSSAGRVIGRVEDIRIYPVRSLAGTAVNAVRVGEDGLAGDRAWTVLEPGNRVLRGKDAPELRDVAASGNPERDAATLTALLGRPVQLAPTPAGGGKVGALHLVSTAALHRAAAGEVPEGCSAEDPRANLLVSLAGEDDDERSWVGRRLRVGDVVLEVTRTPKHCLGVYAEVHRAGELHVGDAVVEDASGTPIADAAT